MEGHSDFVTSAAFSPDGVCIVSGSCDKTVRIWDATGAEVTKMEDHPNSVAFSSDGTLLLRHSHFWIFPHGWVVRCGRRHIRLFWYPPELRRTLFFPPCLRLISNKSQTRLEFHEHTLGTDWQTILHIPPPLWNSFSSFLWNCTTTLLTSRKPVFTCYS
jgi:WD40 repeat protein